MPDDLKPSVQPGSPTIRVLVIDDSPVVRATVERMLGQGFELLVAQDGTDGWMLIQQDPDIDVVFTDLLMPRMNGLDLLRAVRTSGNDHIQNLPVIVATGDDNDELIKQQAFDAGATDFITKPFKSAELQARANSYGAFQRTAKSLRTGLSTDEVTGLANEKMFLDQLQRDLAFAARRQLMFAVLKLEICGFADLFRLVGRKGTDNLLQQVAKVLESNVRQEDNLGRLGVAQFAVSLPAVGLEGGELLATRIRDSIAKFRATFRGEPLAIHVSIGVYAPEIDELHRSSAVIDGLDQCLLQALAQGPGSVCSQGRAAQDTFAELQGRPQRFSLDRVLEQLRAGDISPMAEEWPDIMAELQLVIDAMSDEQRTVLTNQLLGSGGEDS